MQSYWAKRQVGHSCNVLKHHNSVTGVTGQSCLTLALFHQQQFLRQRKAFSLQTIEIKTGSQAARIPIDFVCARRNVLINERRYFLSERIVHFQPDITLARHGKLDRSCGVEWIGGVLAQRKGISGWAFLS